ncbi:hypothetical protein QBC34DRAFT_499986 [Podospora aff. communis PSN243]|uniref:F-box domain-containing protein n=1 Tax=Podospora aff. communis PSN243 TaxID=3040156 RepID=A0AAV9G498_9PEZI|nr:hypothetical protein QBC34DRAFT_499986 [Podospora aff. communis PSN243]
MGALERLPAELLCQILGGLSGTDIRNMRLVNHAIASFANAIHFKEVCFTMCQQDFAHLRAIASNLDYAVHVSSLAYVVDIFTVNRQTPEMLTAGIRKREQMDLRLHSNNPALFSIPEKEMEDDEIAQSYETYTRMFDEQHDILENNLDFQVLEEIVPKLPNLRGIVMSEGNELRIIHTNKPKPFSVRDVNCLKQLYMGDWDDDDAPARHLRALLKAVEKAGTQLRSIESAGMKVSFLDESEFGLHNMAPHLLQNITNLKLSILVAEEPDSGHPARNYRDFVRRQLEACRPEFQKGTLRRILQTLPNLVNLDLQLAEYHQEYMGTFPSPAALSDIIPLDHVWPNLKSLSLSNVETERQELAKFLLRHRPTLESLDLGFIKLTSTSWRKLLPYLRLQFSSENGGRLKRARMLDVVMGKSECSLHFTEGWALGHPDHSIRPHPLGTAVSRYLLGQKKKCPLKTGNILDRYFFMDGPIDPDPFGVGDDDEAEGTGGEEGDLEEMNEEDILEEMSVIAEQLVAGVAEHGFDEIGLFGHGFGGGGDDEEEDDEEEDEEDEEDDDDGEGYGDEGEGESGEESGDSDDSEDEEDDAASSWS